MACQMRVVKVKAWSPRHARGTSETRLRPCRWRGSPPAASGFGEVPCSAVAKLWLRRGERPTQKTLRRHLAGTEDAFIPARGRGLPAFGEARL